MSRPDVVVVGAGVGGLAAAFALGRLGLAVLLLDRRSAPADIAKGELLQPESVRILQEWDALAGLRAAGAVGVGRLAIRDPAGGMLLGIEYAGLPGPYRQILCTEYPTVLGAIADRLPSTVEVRRGVLVEDALRDERGRVAGVRVSQAGRRHDLPARLVVAADGLSSRLRKGAGIAVRRRPYDHRLLAFELADAPVAPEVCAYLTDRGLRLVYPLPGGRGRLYVQVRPEEFREGGLADLSGWADGVVAELPALRPLADRLRAGLATRQLLAVHRLRTPRMTAPGLVLVGESAHAVHPMAAQGMNSSLADAHALAAGLAPLVDGGDGALPADRLDRALHEYERTRLRRLDHTATVSHNAARMLTTTTGVARRLGRRMMRHTSANPRLLRVTAGNMSGVSLHPLRPVDRLYQFGLLTDRRAHDAPEPVPR